MFIADLPTTPTRHNPALASFTLDVRRLDDWPPFLAVGPLKRRECLRRLLVARENVLSKLRQPRAHGSVGQGLDGCGVESAEDWLRRAR